MALFLLLATLGLASLAEAQDALAPQVYCPGMDRWAFDLNGTTTHSGGFVSCNYDKNGVQAPTLCSYFPDGKFYQGPSGRCPTSIAFFDFLCPSFDGMSTSGYPAGTAATADGNPLIMSYNSSENGILTRKCLWNYGGLAEMGCEYSLVDGSFYDQGTQGALKNNPFCPQTINAAQLNSTKFNCLSNDTAGWPLVGSSATVQQQLACTYYDGNTNDNAYYCKYDTTGTLIANSTSTCPGSANAVKAINTPSSPVMCLETNNAGGNLSSVSLIGPNGTMACLYNDNNSCTYFISNGTFNSGPSACPTSIAPGSGPVGTGVPIGAIAEASPVAAAAAASPSSDKENGLPQPVIIALLAMNGALVLGILILGGFWVFRRHSGPTRSVDYTKVYASREGDYYDAPIEPYRPPNRQESHFI